MDTKKLRVLHVHGDLITGGGQVLSREWLSTIDRSKFDPYVVVLNKPTTLQHSFEENEISVTQVFGNRIVQIFKLAKFIVKNDIDIVHTQSEPDRKVGHWAALLTGRPVVAHAHSSWVYFVRSDQAKGLRKLRSQVMLRIRKISERSVVCFVATSDEVKASFEKATKKPVHVIEPGVRLDIPVYTLDQKLQAKVQLGLNENQKLIVNASRLDDLKNLDDFVLAIAKLRTQIDVIGHIYGEGENKKHLEKLITDVGCEDYIKIFRPVDDLRTIFCAADVFLAPSLSESFGMSVLESLTLGLPVVAYGLDAYGRYGQAIKTVPLNDVDGLVSQTETILTDFTVAQSLKEKGMKLSQGFDIKLGTRKLESIYRKNTRKILKN